MQKRKRIIYLFLIIFTTAAGFCARKFSNLFPEFLNAYLGDALWALMIYFISGFIFLKMPPRKTALVAILFCYAIEISQLYHAPWIDNIRQTTLGGLILGFGFLWTDIIAYSLGVAAGMLIETFCAKSLMGAAERNAKELSLK